MSEEKVTWYGNSGKGYTYWVHSTDTNWKDEPANYVFAKVVNGKWSAIYIGETNSLKDRIGSQHEKWQCGKNNGMTHVHAHTSSSSKAVRTEEESDLLANRNPPCND